MRNLRSKHKYSCLKCKQHFLENDTDNIKLNELPFKCSIYSIKRLELPQKSKFSKYLKQKHKSTNKRCCQHFLFMNCWQHFQTKCCPHFLIWNEDNIFMLLVSFSKVMLTAFSFNVVRIVIQICKCCVHFCNEMRVVRIFKKLSASDIWKQMLSAFSFDEIRTTF